jgi:hypothetical protein
MKYLSKLSILLAFISLTIACKEDTPDPSESVITNEVMLSRETNYGQDWIYFSFSQGAELNNINETNYLTDDSWDIAFNRFNVRTNSGLSGIGQAGVIDMGEVEYSSVSEAPQTGYTVDSTIQIVEIISHTGPPQMMDAFGNIIFTDVILLEGQPPSYVPNNHVYVLKTADGHFVKLIIQGFYNDQGESGYLSFKYSYQEDGSRIFD